MLRTNGIQVAVYPVSEKQLLLTEENGRLLEVRGRRAMPWLAPLHFLCVWLHLIDFRCDCIAQAQAFLLEQPEVEKIRVKGQEYWPNTPEGRQKKKEAEEGEKKKKEEQAAKRALKEEKAKKKKKKSKSGKKKDAAKSGGEQREEL